ncbi:MAG: adenylate/guanylate cyclase domain-containing protein [Kiritimatiellae bacterium]|nr:adenylate/guanylate cyclase domain-containing protein [Kiritimatiellia bacterium]
MARPTQFKDLFDQYLPRDLQKSLVRADSASLEAYDSAFSEPTSLMVPDEEHAIQNAVRPWIGKLGVNTGAIGAHPDFAHLVGTDQIIYHHITTLFLDIENSTRLSLLMPLEEVLRIKNGILRAASEMVRAFDGHVHRFMGDALMAFFGGAKISPEDSAMAAINCAAMLRQFMKVAVLPGLQQRGIDTKDLGFRIGIDYGEDSKVLWASYGHSKVNEVTATSFYVDVAAKLQHQAGRNQVMLGDSLLSFLDFPDPFREVKTQTRNGEEEAVPVLLPNLSDANGQPINYSIRKLKARNFDNLLPVPTAVKATFDGSKAHHHPGVTYQLWVVGGGKRQPYNSLSQCLNKGLALEFEVSVQHRGYSHRYPLSVNFRKTNYGAEAGAEAKTFPWVVKTISHPHGSGYGSQPPAASTVIQEEGTAYRGIHQMEVEVKDVHGALLFRDAIGVHIR